MDIMVNFKKIIKNIEEAMVRVNRIDFPVIIAVTKKVSVEQIKAAKQLGITDTGENYVQEMLSKMNSFPDLSWHFIGRLQKNKVKYIVGKVKLIHSVDGFDLASEINKRAEKMGVVQDILIQINQGEETKGGIKSDRTEQLVSQLNRLPFLSLKGLMAMPPYSSLPEASRPYFREIRDILNYLNTKSVYKNKLTELSMGMSGDYTVAVEEGATMLRIGTALFGERKK